MYKVADPREKSYRGQHTAGDHLEDDTLLVQNQCRNITGHSLEIVWYTANTRITLD